MAERNPDSDQQDGRTFEHVFDDISALGEKQDRVSLADMRDTAGQRGYGPFLFVPALLEISPLGGVPGVPTLLGIIIAIFALQMFLGRKHFWIPEFLGRRSVDGRKLRKAIDKMRPVVRLLDKVIRPRLTWVTRRPFLRIVAALCVLCAALAPPLELVPFASTLPFGAIALFGLGLTAHDGIVVLLGMALAMGGLYMAAASLL